MIVSHKYRYVYIQLPHTASTSIAAELEKNYDGEKVLLKHSTYRDFLRSATPEEKSYFAFSSIRHPIDEVVTRFVKYKTNHIGQFTDPTQFKENGGWMTKRHRSQFRFVQGGETSLAF